MIVNFVYKCECLFLYFSFLSYNLNQQDFFVSIKTNFIKFDLMKKLKDPNQIKLMKYNKFKISFIYYSNKPVCATMSLKPRELKQSRESSK